MPNGTKTFEIVAGPNGSGKTSFAQSYFAARKSGTNFINADIIATGLAPGREELAAFRAGRLVLSTVRDALKKGENVAFESTLSGKTWLSAIKTAKKLGYSVSIYFLFLKDVRLNLQRIEKRVRLGGHSVPNNVVKRRYPRSFRNFWMLYRPTCNDWHVFDNSQTKPKSVMSRNDWDGLQESDKLAFEKSFLERAQIQNGQRKTK